MTTELSSRFDVIKPQPTPSTLSSSLTLELRLKESEEEWTGDDGLLESGFDHFKMVVSWYPSGVYSTT